MHHQFNIQQLYALPTLYLCVLYFHYFISRIKEQETRLPLQEHDDDDDDDDVFIWEQTATCAT